VLEDGYVAISITIGMPQIVELCRMRKLFFRCAESMILHHPNHFHEARLTSTPLSKAHSLFVAFSPLMLHKHQYWDRK